MRRAQQHSEVKPQSAEERLTHGGHWTATVLLAAGSLYWFIRQPLDEDSSQQFLIINILSAELGMPVERDTLMSGSQKWLSACLRVI